MVFTKNINWKAEQRQSVRKFAMGGRTTCVGFPNSISYATIGILGLKKYVNDMSKGNLSHSWPLIFYRYTSLFPPMKSWPTNMSCNTSFIVTHMMLITGQHPSLATQAKLRALEIFTHFN